MNHTRSARKKKDWPKYNIYFQC